MNEELINNEELVDTVEDLAINNSKNLKIVAGVGLGIVAGVALYKYVIKPRVAKYKEKKASKIDEKPEFVEGEVVNDTEESKD